MRNLFIVTFVLLFLLACKNDNQQTNNNVDTSVVQAPVNKPEFGVICNYDSVSDEFDFQLSGYTNTTDEDTNNHVSLAIYSKKDRQLIQTIDIEKAPAFTYSCSSFSFRKDYKLIDSISDGIYGDIVVSDFNFDGQEDIAIAFDVGFSEFFQFYLQENGHFVANDFLTENIGLIPELDTTRKTLKTWKRMGAAHVQINVFQYDNDKKQFSTLKWWEEDYDGNKTDSSWGTSPEPQ